MNNHEPSMWNCLHSSVCSFAFPHLCLSHPFMFISCFVTSPALCLYPGTGYVPPLMSLETPSVPVLWNTCPATSYRERTLSSATRWWRRQTRSRTSSSARRTSTRTRGAHRARLRCRRCGWRSNETHFIAKQSAKAFIQLIRFSKKRLLHHQRILQPQNISAKISPWYLEYLRCGVSSSDKLLQVVLLLQSFLYTVSYMRVRDVHFSTTAKLFTDEDGELLKSLVVRLLSVLWWRISSTRGQCSYSRWQPIPADVFLPLKKMCFCIV